MKTRFKQTALLALVLASPAFAQKGGEEGSGRATITDEVRQEPSRAFSEYLERISGIISEQQQAGESKFAGDLIDQVATAVRDDLVREEFTSQEQGLLVATAVDKTATAIAREEIPRDDGRTGDTSTGDSQWWPDDGNWPSTGKSGFINPGGYETIGSYGTDGDLEILDHNWFIELGGEGGTDLVFAAGAMAINGSFITFSQLGELTEDSYTFATVAPGEGRGRFYNVSGLPEGYEIVYGESTISLAKTSITVPEVGAVLPLLVMLMPWTFLRKRRS